jgi:hypothetical protein
MIGALFVAVLFVVAIPLTSAGEVESSVAIGTNESVNTKLKKNKTKQNKKAIERKEKKETS